MDSSPYVLEIFRLTGEDWSTCVSLGCDLSLGAAFQHVRQLRPPRPGTVDALRVVTLPYLYGKRKLRMTIFRSVIEDGTRGRVVLWEIEYPSGKTARRIGRKVRRRSKRKDYK